MPAGLRCIGRPQLAHAAEGMRPNCVVPGLLHAPRIERLAAKCAKGDTGGLIAQRHKQTPIQPMCGGRDRANAVVFLDADESRWVTLTGIVVDRRLVAATHRSTAIHGRPFK